MRSVATDVEWSVFWSEPRALRNRLNRSRCRLECWLGWARGIVFGGSPDRCVHGRDTFGSLHCRYTSYLGISRLVGSQHTQRHSQEGSSDAASSYRCCSNVFNVSYDSPAAFSDFFRRVRVEGDMKKARRVLQCV